MSVFWIHHRILRTHWVINTSAVRNHINCTLLYYFVYRALAWTFWDFYWAYPSDKVHTILWSGWHACWASFCSSQRPTKFVLCRTTWDSNHCLKSPSIVCSLGLCRLCSWKLFWILWNLGPLGSVLSLCTSESVQTLYVIIIHLYLNSEWVGDSWFLITSSKSLVFYSNQVTNSWANWSKINLLQ